MIRGTTAQFRYTTPYEVDTLMTAEITFWQTGNNGPNLYRPLPIVKNLDQCDRSDNPYELIVTLTPEETLRFSEKLKAYTQIQAETIEGVKFASRAQTIPVYPVQDDSMTDDDVVPLPPPDDDGFIILDGKTIV